MILRIARAEYSLGANGRRGNSRVNIRVPLRGRLEEVLGDQELLELLGHLLPLLYAELLGHLTATLVALQILEPLNKAFLLGLIGNGCHEPGKNKGDHFVNH